MQRSCNHLLSQGEGLWMQHWAIAYAAQAYASISKDASTGIMMKRVPSSLLTACYILLTGCSMVTCLTFLRCCNPSPVHPVVTRGTYPFPVNKSRMGLKISMVFINTTCLSLKWYLPKHLLCIFSMAYYLMWD